MLEIFQIPVLNDNYIYLIIDAKSGKTACVDPALHEPVIKKLEELDKKLDFILNTHHHNDHVVHTPIFHVAGATTDTDETYGAYVAAENKTFNDIGNSNMCLKRVLDLSSYI